MNVGRTLLNTTKRAFTLIELLVVMALIAILAAILFPVFAQAHGAAKKTASIHNAKQIALGSILYMTDWDDQFPLVGFPRPSLDHIKGAISINGRQEYVTWALAIYPYVKNTEMYFIPNNPISRVDKPENEIDKATRFGDFGFNYANLNRVGDSRHVLTSCYSTEIENPATTICFGSRTPAAILTDKALLRSDFGFFALLQLDPPVKPEEPDLEHCISGWGEDSPWLRPNMHTDDADEYSGLLTGLFATYINRGLGIVTFVDGHVKSLRTAQAADGANCGSLFGKSEGKAKCDRIESSAIYLWDKH